MTIKKRLFWSNILMIAVPVLAALLAGGCCIRLLWFSIEKGIGPDMNDERDFYWAGHAAAGLAEEILQENSDFHCLDTLGGTLSANMMRLEIIRGGKSVYTYGDSSAEDSPLLAAGRNI